MKISGFLFLLFVLSLAVSGCKKTEKFEKIGNPLEEFEKSPKEKTWVEAWGSPEQEKKFSFEGSPNVLPDDSVGGGEVLFFRREEEPRPFPKKGMIEYSTPERMRVGETEDVEVRISREVLDTLFEDVDPKRRQFEREEMKIYPMMSAVLNAPNFEIVSKPADLNELIPKTGYAAWLWSIKALREGSHTIDFRVSAVYGEDNVREEVEKRTIHVEVGPPPPLSEQISTFWKEHWKWIVGTLIAAIAVITTVVRLFSKRK